MKGRMLLFLTVLTCSYAQASAWAYLASSPSGNKAYALTASGSALFPTVWFKLTGSKSSTVSLSKDVIDCKKGRYAIKEISKYRNNGSVSSSEKFIFDHWNQITPDSLAEYEYKFACHRNLF